MLKTLQKNRSKINLVKNNSVQLKNYPGSPSAAHQNKLKLNTIIKNVGKNAILCHFHSDIF